MHDEQSEVKWLQFEKEMEERRVQSTLQLQQFVESATWEIETWLLTWAPEYIKICAAQYLRMLAGNQHRQDGIIERSNPDLPSSHHPFLGLMAREIGISMEDTALLCDRVIVAGDEAVKGGGLLAGGLVSGLCFIEVTAAHDKKSLMRHLRQCRKYFEEPYHRLTALVPDQGALLVHGKILDELL